MDLAGLGCMPAQGLHDRWPRAAMQPCWFAPSACSFLLPGTAAACPRSKARSTKVAHLGFVTHCTVRLANGQQVLAYRLNSVDGAHADVPVEKQRTYLWWNEADAWAYAGSAEMQGPPGPPSVAHLTPEETDMSMHSDRRAFLKQAAMAGAGAAALGGWPGRASAAGTVNWLAWGGHVEPAGIKSFFDSTGIRVNHIGMSGNAETFAKMKLSGTAQYDLFEADGLWPLRYMQEGMIEPVDLDSIPNVAKNLHPEFKKIPALQAAGGKSLIVPWGWNPTVLIYNKGKISAPPTSYEALLDPKYKGRVSFSDQHEFMWPVADAAGLCRALQDEQGPARQGARHPHPHQAQRAHHQQGLERADAPVRRRDGVDRWRLAGRAMTIQAASGPQMGTSNPKEGYYGWIDGDMLVKGSPNRADALAWINHIHSPEYVAMNFKRLQRGAANRGGVELLKQQGLGDLVKANLMDQPEVALKMRLIRPAHQDEYAAAWNEVLRRSRRSAGAA